MKYNRRNHGSSKMDDQISTDWKQTYWVLDGSTTRFVWLLAQKQSCLLHDVDKNMKIIKLNLQALQQQHQDKNHMSMYHGQMNMLW